MSSDNSGLIADALAKTQPVLSLSIDVEDAWKDWIKSSGAKVSLYRDYERGDHRSSITEQMRKMLRLPKDDSGLNDFNDNYCQIVVDKFAGRLHVSEITFGKDNKAVDDNWLIPLLKKNNWEALQGTLFRGAIRDGDSYVMVDPETLGWTSEPAYDGYSGIYALFENNQTTPYWACKIWSEATAEDQIEVMRLVVYESGRISYWRGSVNGNEVIPDNIVEVDALRKSGVEVILADPEMVMVNARPWPISRIPIVHTVNKYDNYSDSGESEIRPAIPLQDVLNRTLHSMTSASEFSAFNILWSIGFDMDASGIVPGAVISFTLKDENGKVITNPTPEMAQYLSAIRVGQFSGSDISQYTNQIDKVVREISQATQTPIYGITNQGAVSGEALKQLEIGLIGKCERFQRQNTDAVRELIEISAEIQRTFNGDYGTLPNPPAEELFDGIAVNWKSPEILDVTARIAALVTMRRDAPGLWDDSFYQARIGGLMGLSQSEIQQEGDKAREAQATRLSLMVGAGTGNVPPDTSTNPQNNEDA